MAAHRRSDTRWSGPIYNSYVAKGVSFVRPPSEEKYGTVAVFRDLYGNLWDLVRRRQVPP